MKKSHPFFFTAIVLLVIIASCTKDREANINYFKNNTSNPDTTLAPGGDVVINEFVASGSTQANEYGQTTDWIELYNTSDSAINFAHTNYYISDDSTTPDKFVINGLTIPGKSYMVVYCDDSARITTQIHTNFGLSKSGEFLGLYRKDGQGNFVTLTSHPFAAQTNGPSEGRYPDGGAVWTTFPVPTPGAANHL